MAPKLQLNHAGSELNAPKVLFHKLYSLSTFVLTASIKATVSPLKVPLSVESFIESYIALIIPNIIKIKTESPMA